MTIQWPDEREPNKRQSLERRSIDPKGGLHQVLAACPSGLSSGFDDAVKWIIDEGDEIAELERRMTDVSIELDLKDIQENVSLLMVWGCAKALAEAPSLQTWQQVRTLKSNSWQLEHWLAVAMLVCSERETEAKEAYVSLAKVAFLALDNSQLLSQFERHNDERKQLKMAWESNSEKLTEIWWGLRGGTVMAYEEEFPLFKVLQAASCSEFLAVVAKSSNPYLVQSAFWAAGAVCKFSIWEELADSAPSTFAEDSTWNNSVALPLLLVIARDEMLQSSRQVPHVDATETKEAEVKQEIADLAEAVVCILAKRQDAMPLFTRWSTWLMRQLLMQGFKKADDIRSSAAVDDALVDAIGRQLKSQSYNSESPCDAPAWEHWCYRAVLSSHANCKFTDVPDFESFVEEWMINPDDWTGDRGKQLRARANLFLIMNKDIPGDAAYSLAYPIVMSEAAVNKWINLWNAVQPLREIAEFGDADVHSSEDYQSRSEAGKMLLFVFCIGLAILDQSATPEVACDTPHARNLAKLHEALALAVREMREIDDSLNRDQWLLAVRHLAVRRLIWEDNGSQDKREHISIFLPGDSPSFSDYLTAARNDELELVAILQMTLLNESDRQIVLAKIKAASIDLSGMVESVKRLNVIDSKKYPVNDAQLGSLMELAKTAEPEPSQETSA